MLMSSPVVSVGPETPLDQAYRILADRKISSVPVVDAEGKPVGVVSLTDLLRIGRLQPASLAGMAPLDLPAEPVREHMHAGVVTVSPDAPPTRAARLMVEQHIHRVYVEDQGALVGVFSIEEILLAVRVLELDTPVAQRMSRPVITLPLTTTLAEATARLDRVGVTGLVILDEHGHPIGTFTQHEALASRHRAPDTAVERVMSYALVIQHGKTPLHRAAAHAYEARARRVLVVDHGELQGVLTGLDFARILAGSD
jgi:CBS domain-containing protein